MKTLVHVLTVSLFALGPVTTLSAQPRPGVAPDTAQMYEALTKARQIAGADLFPYYMHRCIVDQTYRQTISRGVQAANAIEPLQIFDNVYFVGQNAVSAFVIRTSEGLIILDTLNSPDEAQTYIIGGMKTLGLDPKDVKYIVISHSHGDHFGGAQYFKDTLGATLVAAKADWVAMDKMREEAARAPVNAPQAAPGTRPMPRWTPPTHDATDITIEADGERWTVGDTTFTMYITPPHAPGVLSPIFEVFDRGVKHVAAVYGGLGTPAAAEDKKTHIVQLQRYERISQAAGVDVLLATHQTQDQALWKLEELRLRRTGNPDPYVIGTDRYRRYLQLQAACTGYAAAQQGQSLR